MAPVSAKKRKYFTFEEKEKIIQQFKNGVSKEDIIREYGMSRAMYYKILNRGNEIAQLSNSHEFKNKMTKTSSYYELVEASVFQWFLEKKNMGITVTGPNIQTKALQFNKLHKGPATFKASSGWLKHFKMRHGIKQLRDEGEVLSNNEDAGQVASQILQENIELDASNLENVYNVNESDFEFKVLPNHEEAGQVASQILQEKIELDALNLENVYNVNASGCEFKVLPNFTLASFMKNKAPDHKDVRERFSALFCTNASGTNKIPLLAIGKSAKPRCIKNLKRLPVIYTSSKKAWMNRDIFFYWFEKVFIQHALIHQRQKGITGKILLILNIAPSYPKAEELNAINKNVEVFFLLPNVTASVPPKDQGIIATTKKIYKHELLRELLLKETRESADTFLKNFNLRDAFRILEKAWSSLSSETLRKPWRKLLGYIMGTDSEKSHVSLEKSFDKISEEVVDFLVKESKNEKSQQLLSRSIMQETIENWINRDNYDCGWEPSNNDEIEEHVAAENDLMLDEPEPQPDQDRLEKSMDTLAAEAYKATLTLENWIQKTGTGTVEDLLTLKRLREKAATRAFKNEKTDEIL